MIREVGPRTGCRHRAQRECGRPVGRAGREGEPGRGIHLDHIRRRPPGVPRALDCLHSTERRHPNFDRVARSLLGQQLQQVTDGGRRRVARAARERGVNRLLARIIRYP